MALLDMEGFDGVNTEAHFNRYRHADLLNTSYNATADPFGGGRIANLSFGSFNMKPRLDTGSTTAITRMIGGVLLKTTGSEAGSIFRFHGRNTTHCTIEMGSVGEFRLFNSTTAFKDTAVFTNPHTFWTRNVWHWVEFDVTISNSVGTATIYLDGVESTTWTNEDTQSSSFSDLLSVTYINDSNHDMQWASAYLMDTNGTANNSRLGPFYVQTITPNGDGGTTDWTPLSGLTNYEMIDDATPDDATTYVSSSTVNDTDYYDYTALSTGVGTGNFDTISGVRVASLIRKLSAGDRLIRTAVSSGLSTGEAAAAGVPVDWWGHIGIFEQDPDTSTAWTPAGINAAQFGITIES